MSKFFIVLSLFVTANLAQGVELDCINLDLPGTVVFGYDEHPNGRTAKLQFYQGDLSGELMCGIAEEGRFQLACAGVIAENSINPLEKYVRLRLHRSDYNGSKLAVVQVYEEGADTDTIASAFPMKCNFY